MPSVEAQARAQLQSERGAIIKDWGGRLPIAITYPNTYFLGMSNLGLQAIYRLLNALPDVVCERVFYDPPADGKLASPPHFTGIAASSHGLSGGGLHSDL